ncbi:MAG: hypothetical protein L6R38_003591 [Xanthoria sp. 2 TBL-2021]|nr:MAG: hypothetical protein L6R38_003591 [Xanthoria sp. 2 TBL-2021]
MRGDFRTGKRLNIKRIIPYIASDYKRDKIWMRRSIPTKRNYQIMLAVDDSQSMASLSGGGEGLAFETLALVSKSLSMLEVGELCIVGFGESVTVAHPFDRPFTDEAGADVFQQFSFQQRRTNILKLVQESIALFREARRGNMAANGAEIWQLELIISDGVCEDHEAIRRLVRQATEERIMIVFIIVDSINADANGNATAGNEKGTSIVDMQTAVFEADGEEGEKKLKIKRYLDGFPFGYYVVVGDVRELPGVLSQALRGWFGEVVERGKRFLGFSVDKLSKGTKRVLQDGPVAINTGEGRLATEYYEFLADEDYVLLADKYCVHLADRYCVRHADKYCVLLGDKHHVLNSTNAVNRSGQATSEEERSTTEDS